MWSKEAQTENCQKLWQELEVVLSFLCFHSKERGRTGIPKKVKQSAEIQEIPFELLSGSNFQDFCSRADN